MNLERAQESVETNQSKAFPNGGIYIMRSERIYLAAVCHRIGVNGVGPHKHNDWLSFELCADGVPVIIDPGTYCYTGNMEMRRLFRSTAYHNTVVVDGEEQVPIHNSMFALVNPFGDIHVTDWKSSESFDLLTAQHTGYQRLADPVAHQRTFHLDKKTHQVTVEDSFQGKGIHKIEFYFHLDTEIICEIEPGTVLFSKNGCPVLSMKTNQSQIGLKLNNGWVSRAYNKKEPAQIVSWGTTIDAAVPQAIKHTFFLQQGPDSEAEAKVHA